MQNTLLECMGKLLEKLLHVGSLIWWANMNSFQEHNVKIEWTLYISSFVHDVHTAWNIVKVYIFANCPRFAHSSLIDDPSLSIKDLHKIYHSPFWSYLSSILDKPHINSRHLSTSMISSTIDHVSVFHCLEYSILLVILYSIICYDLSLKV